MMTFKNNYIAVSAAPPAIITVIICSLPHFLNISVVAILVCLAIWGYQAFSLRYQLPVPGLLLRTVAGTLLFVIAVGLNEGLTLEAFVTLLIFMISLKTFELRTKRDCIVTIILCYFLIFSSMLFNDSIFIFAYLLLAIVFTTSALITVNFLRSNHKQTLYLAGKLTLQALPFTVVLFLLFPRIQGGLWGRPPGLSSTSGFSDEITFGTVSRVAQNNKAAFRVTFDGDTPRREQLYWRGIVFSEFDGRTWKEAKDKRRGVPRGLVGDKEKVRYSITLEPHFHRRMFALDLPVRVYASRILARKDYTWVTWRPLTSRLQYTAESILDANPQAISPYSEQHLQLPETGNSRALAVASTWRSESGSDKEYVERVINYFQANNFRYTLNPKAILSSTANNVIDSFLFDTREGFCEHYASAFAFLMRAGGIPVRLVAGYLGGEVNTYGDYMVVRQSDAHVWAEVFIDGTTWQRIDPTLAVAPTRLSRSFRADFDSQSYAASLESWQKVIPDLLKEIADFGDLINNRWNNLVLGYSRYDQIQLFQWVRIDLRLPGGMVKAMVVGTVLLASCGFMVFALMSGRNGDGDKVTAQWRKFCSAMEKIDFPRPAHQGPAAYAQDIITQRPDLEGKISEIAFLYTQLRFNPRCAEDSLERLTRAVKSFAPRPQE